MNLIRKLRNKKGFTLVELIVVIAIIAVLAAIAVPLVSGYVDDARRSSIEGNANVILSACNVAYASTQAQLNGRTDFVTELTAILGDATITGTASPYTVTIDGEDYTVTEPTAGVFAVTPPTP